MRMQVAVLGKGLEAMVKTECPDNDMAQTLVEGCLKGKSWEEQKEFFDVMVAVAKAKMDAGEATFAEMMAASSIFAIPSASLHATIAAKDTGEAMAEDMGLLGLALKWTRKGDHVLCGNAFSLLEE